MATTNRTADPAPEPPAPESPAELLEQPVDPEAAFAAALARFQAEVPHIAKANTAQVKSDKANYSYAYADLTDITLAALPLLGKHGLGWTSKMLVTPAGFLLVSSLVHELGWRETCEWPLPDPMRATPQAIGSALTYGRRYSFTALTGVAPGGDDDDARAANDRPAADHAEPQINPDAQAFVDKLGAAFQSKDLDAIAAAVSEAEASVGLDALIRTPQGTITSIGSVGQNLTRLVQEALAAEASGVAAEAEAAHASAEAPQAEDGVAHDPSADADATAEPVGAEA